MAAAATVPYLPTLGHDFVMDDGVYIAKNPSVTQGAPLAAYFVDRTTTASRVDFRAQSWRPIRTLALRAIAARFGTQPFAFGVANLLLYMFAIALVAGLALSLSNDRWAALVAAALWAFAPVHVEPVAYASALGDHLSLVLELVALIAAGRAIRGGGDTWAYGLASLLLLALALGAKEMAVTEVGILGAGILTTWSRLAPDARRRAVVVALLHAALIGAYVVAHARILGSVGQGEVSGGGIVAGLRAAPVYLWRYAWIVVAPTGHAAAYAAPAVDGTHVALAWAGLGAVALVLFLVRPPTLIFALAWFAVALVPVLHLVPLLAYYADRFAYLPSVGLAFAAAVLLAAPRGRWRIAALTVAGALAVAYFAGSVAAARAWRDDRTLWQAAVDAQPRAALAHANLGLALLRDHRAADALPHLQTARDIDGDKPEVRLGLATAYDQLGRAADAEAAARAAIAGDDADARPHALLGGILAKKGDLAGAAREAERARTLNPDLASAWTLTAHLAEVRGATVEALAAWRRAAALNPSAPDFHAEIARLSLAAGDRAAAAAAARACLRLRPTDARCHSILARAGSP